MLVVLQGANGLTFSPGYTTAAECMQQYKGPNVACFNYDPEGVSWTAFFKLPDGAFRVVRRFPTKASVGGISTLSGAISRPPAGSWLSPTLVTLPV